MNETTSHNHFLHSPSHATGIFGNAVRVGIGVSRMAGFHSASRG